MQANVGNADRVIRIVIGVALLLFAFLSDSPYRWWGLIGVVLVATGFLRWCPLYVPLGVKTCKTE